MFWVVVLFLVSGVVICLDFLWVWIGGLGVFLDSAFVCGLGMVRAWVWVVVVVGFDCGGWCLACGVWVVGLGWLVCVLRAVF